MAKMFGKKTNDRRPKATGKKLHFEDVSSESLHNRDYGLLEIKEAKTPFPRMEDPVSAKMLRERLLNALSRFNRDSNGNDSKSSDEEENPLQKLNDKDDKENKEEDESISSEVQQERHREFVRKRKEFDHGEFTLAKQKRLSPCQTAGPSISNWRIMDDILTQYEKQYHAPMDASSYLLH